ncbi:MAG: peptide ABC transporter substrate-binding protein [Clostridiaceae bacterium]|nr:peptide ABC transporter substrate-binding protein [Clostridiaceae bacterium]
MKKTIALLLSLIMICGMFAACGQKDSTEDNSKTDGQQSQTGDAVKPDEVQTISILHTAEPSILDVARFLGLADRSTFYNILEPLVRIENGVPAAAGAEKWDISSDGLTYTFHLRENYWSDGKAVTSEDYATALKRQATPANAFPFASDYYSIKNFEAVFNGQKDVSELGVTTPDEKTLVIELSTLNVSLLASTDFFPDRADIAEANGDAYGTEADKLLCCGPFVLKTWTHNSAMKLEKNEKYWDSKNVKLQNVTLNIIPDANAQLASFENGSLDYLNVSDNDYVKKFQGRDDMSEILVAAGRTVMVVFNCTDSVFQNQKIRLAFSLSLDRDSLADVITGGTATPAYSLVPKECSVGTLNFREKVEEPLTALKKQHSDVKALLVEGMEEAGLGNDPSKLTVKFSWGATTAVARTYAELYQQIWQQALGCKVELEFNDSPTHMSNVNQGNYQMAATSWGANVEPQFQLSRWATKVGGQSHWINEEYRTLVSKASQTADEKERLDLYAKAEKLLIEDAAIAPVYFTANRRFYYNYVQGLDANTFDTTGLKDIYTAGRK